MAAKRGGMKVTEFFLGLRSADLVVPAGRDRVRAQGDPGRRLREDHRHEQPRGGRSRRRGRGPTARSRSGQRVGVAVAGSTMHFLIAFVLLFVQFAFIGRPDDRPLGDRRRSPPGSAAAAAPGSQQGDRDRAPSTASRSATFDDVPRAASAPPTGAGRPRWCERDGQEQIAGRRCRSAASSSAPSARTSTCSTTADGVLVGDR